MHVVYDVAGKSAILYPYHEGEQFVAKYTHDPEFNFRMPLAICYPYS
jgi:hypothetical protein